MVVLDIFMDYKILKSYVGKKFKAYCAVPFVLDDSKDNLPVFKSLRGVKRLVEWRSGVFEVEIVIKKLAIPSLHNRIKNTLPTEENKNG